jgi:uncharacterized protein (TIGR02599 family)
VIPPLSDSAPPPSPSKTTAAFTLVELLVSISIFSLLMVSITQMIGHTQTTVTRQQARSEEFREARAALESISRNLAGAVMSSYWAHGNSNIAGRAHFTRQSDNHFVSGPATILLANSPVSTPHSHATFFQTADGQARLPGTTGVLGNPFNLITSIGYYIDHKSDITERPSFLPPGNAHPERRRFRLMEFRQPAEENLLYTPTLNINGSSTTRETAYQWFRGPFISSDKNLSSYSFPLAENILALILLPRYIHVEISPTEVAGENSTTTTQLAENYYYDSREKQWGGPLTNKSRASHHQLPPVIQVSLIACEERSYEQLELRLGSDELHTQIISAFSEKFTDHTKYTTDIDSLQTALTALKLHHRIFTSNISLRGSKWIVEEQITP